MAYEIQPKAELDKLMRQAKEKAQESIEISHEGIKSDQQIVDLANAGMEVLHHPTPGNVDWVSTIGQWQRLNDLQVSRVSGLRAVTSTSAFNSGASGTASFMVPFSTRLSPEAISEPQEYTATQVARNRLRSVIDQSINRDELIALMRTLGLDKAYPNERSAVDQFQIAWAAYNMPLTQGSPVNTSLVPMRESIETAINCLLRRRPKQEPAKSRRDKIVSIGHQVAIDSMVDRDLISWADQWDQLEPLLSGSKKGAYSRDEWLDLLRRSTLFLKSFLQGLDPSKLRP
jgi:hypothetical protein